MAEWVQWIIQVVAYGVICFLLKRELGQMDQAIPPERTPLIRL